MPSLDALAGFLDAYFQAENYSDDTNGIFLAGKRAVSRLGLALEPTPDAYAQLEALECDALFLHRPWQLDGSRLPADMGVLAYHLPFDDMLTLGYNPRLAAVLSLGEVEELGYKEGRRIGMVGTVRETSFAAAADSVKEVFGGLEREHPGGDLITRVAVVGALNEKLLTEAHARGVGFYVTGQWRAHAEAAVAQTGVGVVTVGHARSEVWGLNALAHLLMERFAGLEAFVIT
ncbi:Nif3-like dinuclear metal center hexameric protein [soil metagenome]